MGPEMGKGENDFLSCLSNLSWVVCSWAHDSSLLRLAQEMLSELIILCQVLCNTRLD